jgi:L-histidine Nalpha-methyltransferase / hercynylcysteine S-oxide synthase
VRYHFTSPTKERLTLFRNLRKIEILLTAIDKLGKKVDYYALDLSLAELERTLAAVSPGKFQNVNCYGLHGTYDDGLDWLKTSQVASKPKAVLSMGSSIGNFTKPGATLFVKSFGDILRPGDCLLIGIDACKDPEKIFHAYNDQEGVTHQFILNGLHHANHLLRSQDFDIRDWKVFGEYKYDDQGGRHVAFVSPAKDVVIDGIKIRKNEKIQIEESHKYAADDANRLFNEAGLVQGARWSNQHADYGRFYQWTSFRQ